ncbi:DUF1120 domain-containing protein [Pandoraea sputorum]|uniref:DUF1120 domain-containing protein n=1 Tax=Pandoraea sputorum TaxID=93222 RepID=A0A5E5APT1_9BURK|nr:DUF1120 domain-containing protein [Pandoraea sputorum]VVE75729.1 hypothetical protein PSP31121_00585 [Pandoraea sputorum]
MNKKFALHFVAAAALATACSAAFAADTAEIRVIGRVSPGTCSIVLGNNGDFDYGTKLSNTVSNQTGSASLGVLTTNFNITCDAETKMALELIDSQAASKLSGTPALLGETTASDDNRFGLGTADNGNEIGAYAIGLKTADLKVFDGQGGAVTASAIGSIDVGATWAVEAGAHALFGTKKYLSWGETTGAANAQTVSGTLDVEAAVAQASSLPADYDLNGVATLEVKYL